jgi:hypothetical protein
MKDLLINDRWIESGDGNRFHRAVSLPEIIFKHANVRLVPNNPINMITGKPISLRGPQAFTVK